jgi:hypothetical protein
MSSELLTLWPGPLGLGIDIPYIVNAGRASRPEASRNQNFTTVLITIVAKKAFH